MTASNYSCNCQTEQDCNGSSELVNGTVNYVRECQEHTEFVTGISQANGLFRRGSDNDLVMYCITRIEESNQHTELESSAGHTLQVELVAARGNTCPPLQETDPSCSGVMIVNNCDIIVVQR